MQAQELKFGAAEITRRQVSTYMRTFAGSQTGLPIREQRSR